MGLPEHRASPTAFMSDEYHTLLAPKPAILTPRQTPHKSHKRPLVKRPVHGSGSGAKACTQCGTTRTPQWREGPLGAKTLCNACGVKLVRKKRSMLEAERRAAGLAPPPKGTPLRYLLLAPAAMAELAGSPATSGVHSEPEAAAWQQHHHTSAAVTSPSGRSEDGGAPMSQRRPQRRAAARAAEITAEFASTGDWPEAPTSSAAARLAVKPQPQASSASDHSEQASLQGLDGGAEEVAWPAAPQLAPAPSLRLLPETSAAAVDLLTMSVKAEEPAAVPLIMGAAGSGCSAVPQPVQLWRPVAAVPPAQPRADASNDADAVPEQAVAVARQAAQVGAAKTGFSQRLSAEDALVEHYLRAALPSKMAMLDALSGEAEEGWRQSAAADAAVAAVAKFLAKKQAAAIIARSAAKAATQKLHVYLREVDEQHHIVRSHKRRRTGTT